MGRRILLRKSSRGYEQSGPINVFKVAELIDFILVSHTRYLVYKKWLLRPLCKYITYTYLVEISMAICTDLLRLSLMCRSTGSMLWMSMLVTTLKKTHALYIKSTPIACEVILSILEKVISKRLQNNWSIFFRKAT